MPDQHTIGWTQQAWDSQKIRLHPEDVGVITRIANAQYVYLDDDRGGFHWSQFQRVE